mgnify:CR=1 FL=1
MQSLITPYPKRGHLDEVKIGQEDEATPDPDGVPWEVEDAAAQPPDNANDDDDDLNNHVEIKDYDPDDWNRSMHEVTGSDGAGECEVAAPEVEQGDSAHHGDGDGDGEEATDSLSVEQADSLLAHSSRLQALKHAKNIFNGIGGAVGVSLSNTVDRVMSSETKRFRRRMTGDASVDKALHASLHREEAQFHCDRMEFQEHTRVVKEAKRAKLELTRINAEVKKATKNVKDMNAMVMAREAEKTYSIYTLGYGKKNGGGKDCQKARADVLERLRSIAPLSIAQNNDWEYFVTSWDREMAQAVGENWGSVFAEIIQKLRNDLEAGNKTALSDFMYNETKRVLAHVPNLVLPGAS